jgi:hypothetical protein
MRLPSCVSEKDDLEAALEETREELEVSRKELQESAHGLPRLKSRSRRRRKNLPACKSRSRPPTKSRATQLDKMPLCPQVEPLAGESRIRVTFWVGFIISALMVARS